MSNIERNVRIVTRYFLSIPTTDPGSVVGDLRRLMAAYEADQTQPDSLKAYDDCARVTSDEERVTITWETTNEKAPEDPLDEIIWFVRDSSGFSSEDVSVVANAVKSFRRARVNKS